MQITLLLRPSFLKRRLAEVRPRTRSWAHAGFLLVFLWGGVTGHGAVTDGEAESGNGATLLKQARAVLAAHSAWTYEVESVQGARGRSTRTTLAVTTEGILRREDYAEFTVHRKKGEALVLKPAPESSYSYLYFADGIWVLYPGVATAVEFPSTHSTVPLSAPRFLENGDVARGSLDQIVLPECGEVEPHTTERTVNGVPCHVVTVRLSAQEVRRRSGRPTADATNATKKAGLPFAQVWLLAKSDLTPRGAEVYTQDGRLLQGLAYKSFDMVGRERERDFAIPETYTEFHPRSLGELNVVKSDIMNKQKKQKPYE